MASPAAATFHVPRPAPVLWRQLAKSSGCNRIRKAASITRTAASARFRSSSAPDASRPSFVPFSFATERRSYSSELSSQQSRPPPPPPPPNNSDAANVKFWPFVLILVLGFGAYAALVQVKLNEKEREMAAQERPAPAKLFPSFSPSDVTVIFVLGGPGAGKGTQCARLVSEHGFIHLSAGDLLRAEQERPGSQFGQLIRDCIKNGEIVPLEVTLTLLENAMNEAKGRNRRAKFLIDGFPRKMDQALRFEELVCPARCVLFYDCPEAVMERRLLERGKTSGRADDNAESIRKRFKTFVQTSLPVVDHYDKEGRVIKIVATRTPDHVYAETQKELAKRLGDAL